LSKQKTLILIDGHALVHRAFHALPPLNTGGGELVNAVFGFTSILLKVLKDLAPDYIAATFDLAGPTFRHKEFEDYKATRVKAPDELYAQIARVKDVLGAFNIPVYEKEGFEADDVIGTIARQAKKDKVKTIIVTGDLDTLQLVDKDTEVFTLKKGVKDTVFYDEAAVRARFEGLGPEQMVDYKGLKGDPSDNIPGVPGVGEKTAIELLKQYGSLDELYKELENPKGKFSAKGGSASGGKNVKLKDKLLANKEQAFFSKYLATIKCDAPIKFKLKDALAHDYDKEKVIKIFKELGFYSLISRLPGEVKAEPVKTEEIKPVSGQSAVYEKIEQARTQGILSDKLYQLEKELVPVIAMMEQNGIKINSAHLKKLSVKVNKKIKELEKKIIKLAGVKFNINSPQQLSQVLFEKLGVGTKGLKKTPGRVISTAAGELAKLKDQHAIVEFILQYRELMKLKTTYIDALPRLVAKDGRLHTSFDALGTSTGRLSSKNPNLQNIPVRTEFGKEIRKAFVADKGYKLLSADYSQIELRVVAHLAGDKDMKRAFKENKDIHTITASEVLGVEPAKVSKEMRRVAKVLNFGVLYGMSVHGFAEAAGIDNARAKEFIKKYFTEFAGVAKYVEQTKQAAAKDSFVQTLFGRKRYIPEINSSAWSLRQAAERMAINMPVQGTAADIMKLAMVAVAKRLPANIKLLLQVHDELVLEVPIKEVKATARLVKEIMENVYEFSVPIKAEVEAGDNWGELRPVSIKS